MPSFCATNEHAPAANNNEHRTTETTPLFRLELTPQAAAEHQPVPALLKVTCIEHDNLPETDPVLIWTQPDGAVSQLVLRGLSEGVWVNQIELPAMEGDHELALLATPGGSRLTEALEIHRWQLTLPEMRLKEIDTRQLKGLPAGKDEHQPAQAQAGPAAAVKRSWPMIGLQFFLFNLLLAFGAATSFMIYAHLPQALFQRLNGSTNQVDPDLKSQLAQAVTGAPVAPPPAPPPESIANEPTCVEEVSSNETTSIAPEPARPNAVDTSLPPFNSVTGNEEWEQALQRSLAAAEQVASTPVAAAPDPPPVEALEELAVELPLQSMDRLTDQAVMEAGEEAVPEEDLPSPIILERPKEVAIAPRAAVVVDDGHDENLDFEDLSF